MKKALLVITSDIYVRNYLRTDALAEIRKVMKCDVIADSRIKNTDDLFSVPEFLGFFSYSDQETKRHEFHFSLMMWRHRKKSKTFGYRWARNSGWNLVQRSGKVWMRMKSFIGWVARALLNPQGLRIPLLANRLTFPLVAFFLRTKLAINTEIANFINGSPYDVILVPSAAYDAATVDVIRIGRAARIPTICLIDNWDNLTSKTVFWNRPDFLGVWGPQARNQAIEIHGFSPDQIVMIGTPRFDPYFELREKEPQSHYEFPYILFVGSAMPFDEIEALRHLERLLDDDTTIDQDLRIVYRPHPWQQKRVVNAVLDERNFSRVVLDSQIRDAYENGLVPGVADERFQPSLDYYPALLAKARIVAGPLTTMLLEAALTLRPVIGLSYFDGYHANTSLRYFSHFEGTEEIPGFILCESRADIRASLKTALTREQINPKNSDDATSYFVFRDSRSYAKRLADFVSAVAQ